MIDRVHSGRAAPGLDDLSLTLLSIGFAHYLPLLARVIWSTFSFSEPDVFLSGPARPLFPLLPHMASGHIPVCCVREIQQRAPSYWCSSSLSLQSVLYFFFLFPMSLWWSKSKICSDHPFTSHSKVKCFSSTDFLTGRSSPMELKWCPLRIETRKTGLTPWSMCSPGDQTKQHCLFLFAFFRNSFLSNILLGW